LRHKRVLTQAYDDALSKQGEKTNIEQYAIRNGHFSNAFKKSPSVIFSFTFNKLFLLNSKPTNDW